MMESILTLFSDKLKHSNDRKDTVLANRVSGQNRWLELLTRFLRGHDFVNFTKLRINALQLAPEFLGAALQTRCVKWVKLRLKLCLT